MPLTCALAVLLSACGGGSADEPSSTGSAGAAGPSVQVTPEPTTTTGYPGRALLLRDTIPASYLHRTLIAYAFQGQTSHLDVVGPDGNTTLLVVKKGQTYSAKGFRFTVLDVVPNDNTSGAPGGSTGQLVLLPL